MSLNETKETICSAVDSHCSKFPDHELIVPGGINRFAIAGLKSEMSLSNIVNKPIRGQNKLDHVLVSENLKAFDGLSTVS